jgi:hypothetical protein
MEEAAISDYTTSVSTTPTITSMFSNKIAALNWRWRIQFGHRGFQFGFGCTGCSLPAPVSELKR